MKAFQEIFEDYGGNYKETMGRFMSNHKMYRRFLDMLFQDENMKRLGEALEQGNLNEAFEAAHTLKGVAGNMGLTPLYESVCRIVEPLRKRDEKEDYAGLYRQIQTEFQKAEELREALKEGE
jgi:HPt (histidine-containing phosphotransfer) domain-containing protein